MSSENYAEVFVGLDWAVHTHAVCVIDAAGGVPTVLRALGDLLHPDAVLADGTTVAETQQRAREVNGVVHDRHEPIDADGAFRVVRGNLAPDGALIKRSAATPSLLRHRGPAYVMTGADDVTARTGPDATAHRPGSEVNKLTPNLAETA